MGRKGKKRDKRKKPEIKCFNNYCKNLTVYKFCKKCNDDNKYLNSTYMVSTCEKCRLRDRGNYKICRKCSENDY